jgi:hypothetical protein
MVLTGLWALSGCRHTVHIGSPVLTFHQGEASCGAGADDALVQAGPGFVRFSGRMTMPDPCHQLEAVLETTNPSEFVVHIAAITPKPSDGFCIKCIGQAAYSGEIVNVRPGQYTVRIRHSEREIKRAIVTVY